MYAVLTNNEINNTKTTKARTMLSQRALTPTRLAIRLAPLPAVSLLSHSQYYFPHHATIQNTRPAETRPLSTTTAVQKWRRRDPPRLNTGPPSGFLSQVWSSVPDGAKTAIAVIGGCATLMVVGPLFFFVAPPLFVGGFFIMTRNLRRREREMTDRWHALENTRLVYHGPEDEEQLRKFTEQRVDEAVETNECDIIKALGCGPHINVSLTETESINRDMRFARDGSGAAFLRDIKVLSFGLLYSGRDHNPTRIGTVILTLQPQHPDSMEFYNDCIIEVVPLMPFKTPVMLDTPGADSWGSSGRTIDIKAKRTRTASQ